MLCLTIFSPLIARLLAYLVVYLTKGRTNICWYDISRIKQRSERWLWFGFWISFLDETYLFLLVCASLNLHEYFEWHAYGDAINSLLALLLATILVVFPLFVATFYSKKVNQEKIKSGNKEFTERFGGVIEGLNFKRRGRWALFYPCLQMIRKIWLAYILVFQYNKPIVSIFCVMLQGLMMVAVTGLVEPMKDVSKNRM